MCYLTMIYLIYINLNNLSKCPGELHPAASSVDKFPEIATPVPNYASPANK